jgi:hypothetical protein
MGEGVVDRIPNYGPLGGYGYFLTKHRKKIGKVRPVSEASGYVSSPYSNRKCQNCDEYRNGYENHYCAKEAS